MGGSCRVLLFEINRRWAFMVVGDGIRRGWKDDASAADWMGESMLGRVVCVSRGMVEGLNFFWGGGGNDDNCVIREV